MSVSASTGRCAAVDIEPQSTWLTNHLPELLKLPPTSTDIWGADLIYMHSFYKPDESVDFFIPSLKIKGLSSSDHMAQRCSGSFFQTATTPISEKLGHFVKCNKIKDLLILNFYLIDKSTKISKVFTDQPTFILWIWTNVVLTAATHSKKVWTEAN